MREIKKYKIAPRIIDDKEIKDGIEAISQLNGKCPYFLVGGVATQSYLPTFCRRPTSDIDSSVVRPLNYKDFLEITEIVAEYMRDKDYIVTPRKGSRAFSLHCTPKNGYDVILEFVRRNEKNFKVHKKRLERELENSNRKIVEGREVTYSVKRPEDISIPKLVRMINSIKRNPNFLEKIPFEFKPINKECIVEYLKIINNFREEIMHNPADLGLAEKLRFISDMYDIRMLGELVGFNENYFKIAESDWRDINRDNSLRNKILRAIFPYFLDNFY